MARLVRIRDAGRTVEVNGDQTILDAALANGIDYPFGCQLGSCGLCKSTLLKGAVDLLPFTASTLTEEERSNNIILACRAIPLDDCDVTYCADTTPETIAPREVIARVVDIVDATHDIKVIRLAIADGTPLEFLAGQFATLTFPGLDTREYSMANMSRQPLLEFHIRRIPGGLVSEFVHKCLKIGDEVMVRGPHGSSYLRRDHTGPVLAIAGGSGLAPIKSIVDTALESPVQKEIALYFGARTNCDVYLEDHFASLAQRHTNFRYIPILSQPRSSTNRRTGLLADAIEQDFQCLAGWKAYLAGPPIMVDTCTAVLTRLGLGREDCHADAFYTRPKPQLAHA